MYVSWLVGPALQITLLTFMIQRKLHLAFPRVLLLYPLSDC